jgi:hypothetical protein
MEQAEIIKSSAEKIASRAKFAFFVTTFAVHVSALKVAANARHAHAWLSYGWAQTMGR